ncbi:APC family permease [Haloimpatiens sp. FM7315]|uniref:APC family permease n=1 Tax=Haloimpatiens sp. FM7315 TaxID=3298609 RepID=UPI00370B4130
MRKKLNKIDILSLALGSIIGFGSFTLPGSKFLHESGIISTAAGLILGGFAIMFIQRGYHIMLAIHHEDGGEFSYTYEHMGKTNGFVVGWSLTLCYISMIPLNATAFALVLKKFITNIDFLYLYQIAGYPVYLSEIIIASLIIIIFTYINIKGLQMSSKIQNFIILFMITNTIIIFLFMIYKTDPNLIVNNYIINYEFSLKKILKVFAISPFLFVGFDVIPQVATELSFEPKKATKIAILAIFSGVLFYNILNIITGFYFTPLNALKEEWALGSAVLKSMGVIGFVLLIISLAGAVAGGINGFMLGSSRLVASLAKYKFIPKKYNTQNKNGVFSNAIKFVALISLIAPWLGRSVIIYIVDMSSLLASIAYFYVCYISYKNSNGKDKALSLIGALVSLIFILLLIVPESPARLSKEAMLITVLWGMLGFFYYKKYILSKKR